MKNKEGKIISVISSRGGYGKTTIAVTIAASLAKSFQHDSKNKKRNKVILVDFDFKDGQVGFLTNTTYPKHSKEPIFFETENEFDVLLFPPLLSYIKKTEVKEYINILKNLKKEYNYIIVDTASNYLDPLLEHVIYPNSDKLLCITNITPLALKELPVFLKSLNNLENVGIIVNKNVGIITNNINAHSKAETTNELTKAAQGVPILSALSIPHKEIIKALKNGPFNSLLDFPEFTNFLEKK